MTIKKLTVAAAIAVGIATCSFSSAMAACPCNSNMPAVSSGCPCQPVVTPENARCPICGLDKASCGCKPKMPCGCEAQAPCGCGCAPSPCCEQAVPACASCANPSCNAMDMKQAYAYPRAVFGDNYYVGQQKNSIYSTYSAWEVDNCDRAPMAALGLPFIGNGRIMGAAAPCGCGCDPCPAAPCGCGCEPQLPVVTGFATPAGCECIEAITDAAPCASNCLNSSGAVVSNGNLCNDCQVVTNPVTGLITTPIQAVADGITTGLATALTAPFDWLVGNTGMPKGDCPIKIKTSSSLDAIKRSFASCPMPSCSCSTGAAAPLVSVFRDVPDGFWAGCAIDRLAATNVIAGYPDRTFKPQLPVSRAEFASMIIKGLNLNLAGCECLPRKVMYKDVSKCHWANPAIAKATQEGIMAGYCDGKFKPDHPVSRVEALTALAHGINCDMSDCKAKEILSQYCDGDKVPQWAQIPVAKALETGVLKCSPSPNTINPCKDASRADIASMMQTVRIAAGYDKDTTPTISSNTDCAAPCPPKTTYMETEECIKIPTLKLEFLDEINAKSSHVGQFFVAKTIEEMNINGKCYPCGSRVTGKVVEVIRPTGCKKGALKLAFTSIADCDGCKAALPRQILTAQVECNKTPNIIARLVTAPFTLAGTLVGTAARTTGGIISNLGNAAEHVSNGTGIALGDVFQGQFGAAARSLADAAKATIMAPIDATATAVSGAIGLIQTTTDEVAYLVTPDGYKVSAVNPREHVTIAFGCAE